MARLIVVDSKQLQNSLARFEQLLAKDAAEQDRLKQLQQRAAAQPDSSMIATRPVNQPTVSEEEKR
ncbi:MAG: hypothetical protein FJ030_13705 [Chloroflexi bacterium]|nr:hypothetical protein [Chloroflexota bacterium]